METMIARVRELFRMMRIGGRPKGVDTLYNLDDVKRCAEKRLPKMIYDFIDGGAYDEITMASNKSDFSRITFRPKMLADVTRRNYRVSVLGQDLEFPVLISPAGLLRLAHPEGELAMAKAAGKTGVVFIVSTAASYSIKEIADSATGPLWFQLYLWSDRDVIRSLVVKGIMTPQEAKKALDCGADGIMVSNHGGRQLDGLPSTIRVLPDIAEAVGENTDIILDGGIRRGSDVIKALALGAKAVMTGRSWIWGLAAAGQVGAERVQAILAEEIDQTMALLGCSSLTDLDRDFVVLPASWKR